MSINLEQLKDWQNEARRGLNNKADRLRDEGRRVDCYLQVMDATDELLSQVDDLKEELDRKQEEIDDLEEQLEQKNQVIADLRQQLLEAQNLQLETEKQQLESEVNAKPTEIHNHFEPGSSAQVFNDKVNGKFTRKQIVKKDKKDKKKRWKKIVRKVL